MVVLVEKKVSGRSLVDMDFLRCGGLQDLPELANLSGIATYQKPEFVTAEARVVVGGRFGAEQAREDHQPDQVGDAPEQYGSFKADHAEGKVLQRRPATAFSRNRVPVSAGIHAVRPVRRG